MEQQQEGYDQLLHTYVEDEILKFYPENERQKRDKSVNELLRKTLWRFQKFGLGGKPFNAIMGDDQARLDGFIEMIREIAEDNFRLRNEVDYDTLTELFRQSAFNLRYESEIRRLNAAEAKEGEKNHIAMLMEFDLDYLKRLNERFGHEGADKIIKKVAKKVSATVRSTDAAGRWKGDEFSVLFTDTDEEHAVETAKRVFEAVGLVGIYTRQDNDELVLLDPAEYEQYAEKRSLKKYDNVGLSAGVEKLYKGENATLEVAHQVADNAAYTSKYQGRNALTFRNKDGHSATVYKFRSLK